MTFTLQEVAWLATSVGILITGGSAFLAYRTLQRHHANFAADHDRSKRACAVDLILQWNQNTLSHRRTIEASFPGLLDKNTGKVVELTKKQASDIYNAQPNTPAWELRFHLIELLNFFEAVAVAYEHGVADRKLIEDSFRGILRNYYEALHNFIAVVEESRGTHPWHPYDLLMRRWSPQVPPLPSAPDQIGRRGA